MIRTLFLAAVLGGCATVQTPQKSLSLDVYAEREHCQPEIFAASLTHAVVFPELKRDVALAVCDTSTPSQYPNGKPYMSRRQELRIIDPTTLTELTRQDIGCCSRKIVISLKNAPDPANPEGRNSQPLSPALQALGVTRSAIVYVDEDGGASGQEMVIQEGVWQLRFYA